MVADTSHVLPLISSTGVAPPLTRKHSIAPSRTQGCTQYGGAAQTKSESMRSPDNMAPCAAAASATASPWSNGTVSDATYSITVLFNNLTPVKQLFCCSTPTNDESVVEWCNIAGRCARGGGAPPMRKRHQQEHRPQRPSERSDPTQHAKGRTGDCPGPVKKQQPDGMSHRGHNCCSMKRYHSTRAARHGTRQSACAEVGYRRGLDQKTKRSDGTWGALHPPRDER